MQALKAANSSDSDRVLYVPKDLIFTMFPFEANFLNDVTFRVDGTIRATQDYKNWPNDGIHSAPWWFFNDCNNIKFEGSGVLDG